MSGVVAGMFKENRETVFCWPRHRKTRRTAEGDLEQKSWIFTYILGARVIHKRPGDQTLPVCLRATMVREPTLIQFP